MTKNVKIISDRKGVSVKQKKLKAPVCHFTPMIYEASDYEEWWECRHCGHTKSMGMMNTPH